MLERVFVQCSKKLSKNVISQIMNDNLRFTVIWSFIESIFWVFCLIMTQFDELYRRCTEIYVGALVVSVYVFVCSLVMWMKSYRWFWLIDLNVMLVQMNIMFVGDFVAQRLAPQTIIIFAAVLLVPVMFLEEIIGTICLCIVNIGVVWTICANTMDPDIFRWIFLNLIIFSIIGILLGYFVNRARFERYVFAESAMKTAELQRKYAYCDALTGVLNRRAYAERLDIIGKDDFSNVCVVMIDINGLKHMNDEKGHAAGDDLIIGTANCLKDVFGDIGIVYRLGGDEFCVILEAEPKIVEDSLTKLLTIIKDYRGEYVEGISLSYGWASGKECEDVDSLMKLVDDRMYDYKSEYYRTTGFDRRRRK